MFGVSACVFPLLNLGNLLLQTRLPRVTECPHCVPGEFCPQRLVIAALTRGGVERAHCVLVIRGLLAPPPCGWPNAVKTTARTSKTAADEIRCFFMTLTSIKVEPLILHQFSL